MFGMPLENFIFVGVLSFIAAAVDAIAGGGGLISLPAFMSIGIPIHLVMGSHKLASTISSVGSCIKFFTSGKMTTSLLKYLVPLNFLGACLGVYVLNMIDEKILEPLIIFLLFVMLIYTVVNKNIGLEDNFKGLNKKNIIAGCIMSTVIGFYNGLFGPGTGSFLLFAFIKIYGMDFVISTGNAKVLNLVGNFASLIMFIYYGNIEYTYALIFGAVMFFGGHCGAKLAISKGGKFVKPFFVIVTSITLAKMVISKFF